ncbi:DMT family transporter [Thalassospira mesophila]|uniref:Permease of the drug/metabolite transporter (DMT) superfamily n=1 Tax=Thalassospira mesophila TaxID=1293891 RepID=A0A1Y2L2P7_9PROT|nr:DMT family transporter [Thalassospira mesophila]OSQ38842.1 permease of the drug/metabolite transporter (DMT) superfamily [Thalassospira mesophila]
MTRWQANGVILFVALIWGTTFVVQQTSMDSIGPFYFTGVRFLLGTVAVLPFALREVSRLYVAGYRFSRRDKLGLLATGIAMFLASILQQIGIMDTSVTNAAFLTAFYVPTVPILALLVFRIVPHWAVWPGGVLCVMGTYMLSGGDLSGLGSGDFWVIGSAFFWACQVVLVGIMAKRTRAPLTVAAVQFFVTGVLGMAMGTVTEDFSLQSVYGAGFEILYAGIMSAGVAFTLQCVAQNYTEAADAAIIMSAEAVFAAIAGAIFLGERLLPMEYAGCGLILAAIIGVQLMPLLRRRRRVAAV